MKKILIFSLAYYPSYVSGAEVAIKEITDRVTDFEFHLVTHLFDPSAPRYEKIGTVHVYRVGFGNAYVSKVLYVPLAALKARSLHAKLGFTALWAMMTYMLLPLVLAKFLGVRIPYILTLQDGDPYEKVFERWFIKPFVPILDYGFRNATIIQAISKYLAEWPAKRGYTRTVVLIPNGSSLESAQTYTEEELSAVRASLSVKPGEVLLLTVARLVHQKAQDQVIRALTLLPKHIRYVLAGDGEDRKMLEELAQSLGVGERVTFVGHVERTMTAKLRKIAHVFVYPSRSEGQGISLLSTMASGLPVVATQVGGIADFLFDAKRNPGMPQTGWAVDVDSPSQIAEAITEVLSHPDTVAHVTENARRLMQDTYSWDSIARHMRAKVFDR